MGLSLSQRIALTAMMEASRLQEMAAARHRTPKTTVAHPKGVIVKNDPFMTEKLQDPDYVPYCGPCEPMQRLRRVEDGFVCPSCGNKSNWDLSKFNGNVDVTYDDSEGAGELPKAPEPVLGWNADKGKKNTETKPCGRCQRPFFGIRKRKYCIGCQPIVDKLRDTINGANNPGPYSESSGSRQHRRHG